MLIICTELKIRPNYTCFYVGKKKLDVVKFCKETGIRENGQKTDNND